MGKKRSYYGKSKITNFAGSTHMMSFVALNINLQYLTLINLACKLFQRYFVPT